jgi:hypothetical protein
LDLSEVGGPDAAIGPVLFQLKALRFSFEAREAIHFPAGKSANILRGAFGTIFRKLACVPECKSAGTCEIRSSCPYAQMFEPTGPAPSGLSDWPRPFVFRAGHLDDATIEAGAAFHFEINLFDLKSAAEKYLELAFAQLAREGLGAGRSKVELVKVESEAVSVPLFPAVGDQTKISLRFVTPTELKSKSQITPQPDFDIVAARIRDRVSALCEFYGDGAPKMDYKAFAERSGLIRMTRCQVQQVDVQRRSSRTGQVHSIGGFVGEADYEGPVAEFIPWLEAARWTGVGRQTVWGKGVIHILSVGG